MSNIEEIRSQVNDSLQFAQEGAAALGHSTELRQEFAAFLGKTAHDIFLLGDQIGSRREQIGRERPEVYAEMACDEIDRLGSTAPEVMAAREAFIKSKEEGEKDNAQFAFDEKWGSGYDAGPIGDVLYAIRELQDKVKEAAAFVAAQTVGTPSSHTANAVQYIQEGAAHLTNYRDSIS